MCSLDLKKNQCQLSHAVRPIVKSLSGVIFIDQFSLAIKVDLQICIQIATLGSLARCGTVHIC